MKTLIYHETYNFKFFLDYLNKWGFFFFDESE